LIALAVAVSLRCDGCIAFHTAAARKHGAGRTRLPKLWESRSSSMPEPHSCIRCAHSTLLRLPARSRRPPEQ
jgi:AhpD family alkylhydroperoxidase